MGNILVSLKVDQCFGLKGKGEPRAQEIEVAGLGECTEIMANKCLQAQEPISHCLGGEKTGGNRGGG